MAVNRCRNLFNLLHHRSLLSAHGASLCLLVNSKLARAQIMTDSKGGGGGDGRSPSSGPPLSVGEEISGASAAGAQPSAGGGGRSLSSRQPAVDEGEGAEGEEEHRRYEDSIRNNILKASLPFVHNYGWSKDALSAGAESLGYPGIAHGMFPRGGAELVQYFYVTSNQELVQLLKHFVGETVGGQVPAAAADSTPFPSPAAAAAAGAPRKVKDPKQVISYAVETRLRMMEPYLSHWPQALAIMTLPPNVPTSLANLLTLVDDIWYYAGDRSVDFNWYTRRVALAGIYKMTELYMIQDGSPDHQNTWLFLGRRLEEATHLHSLFEQGESATQFAKEVAAATFITARNILGLNWNR